MLNLASENKSSPSSTLFHRKGLQEVSNLVVRSSFHVPFIGLLSYLEMFSLNPTAGLLDRDERQIIEGQTCSLVTSVQFYPPKFYHMTQV